MMVSAIGSFDLSAPHAIIILILLALPAYLAVQKYQKGLNQYPGPLLASLTNNWRLVDVWKRNAHVTYRELHNQYGAVVRVAPNVLSFGDPSAIPDIYGLNKGYTKVDLDNSTMRWQR